MWVVSGNLARISKINARQKKNLRTLLFHEDTTHAFFSLRSNYFESMNLIDSSSPPVEVWFASMCIKRQQAAEKYFANGVESCSKDLQGTERIRVFKFFFSKPQERIRTVDITDIIDIIIFL